ncbi:MAG: hypothetical protein WCJ35_08025 [Planctomycetota bacterium]
MKRFVLLLAVTVIAGLSARLHAEEVAWKTIGEAKGVVGMASIGGKLFACTADKNLQVCDPASATVEWKTIGGAPGPVVAMGVVDGKFCASLNARAGGRFLKRDAVETSADWQDDGHAWCLVGMAGAAGKIFALVDTKEAGSEATIMAREAVATPEVLAKLPPAQRGLDGLPWTAASIDRRPPVGALAMTEAGGKFYIATKEDKLFVGNPTKPDVKWQEIGDAPGVTVLAGSDGWLFAATKSGKLLMAKVK